MKNIEINNKCADSRSVNHRHGLSRDYSYIARMIRYGRLSDHFFVSTVLRHRNLITLSEVLLATNLLALIKTTLMKLP